MPGLDTKTLGAVFQGRPDILDGIKQAADTPARVSLFNNIASYVHQQLSSASEEPAAKRRRVDIVPTHGQASSQENGATNSSEAAATDPVLLEIKDISLSVPQRKKYDLCFTKNFLYARASGTSAPVKGIVYLWKDIEHAFYLPVPEKSQAQYSYLLFPRNSYLPGRTASSTDPEPLVFTVPATAPKPGCVAGTMAAAAAAVSDTYSSLLHWALTTHLRSGGNKTVQIVSSDAKLFHSAARNAYRPNEKAVHVKAFRGSKDGFLFFLPTGILWGFKKPLIFLPLDKIVAVSYTNVLQRTFNIVVEVDVDAEDGKAEELEFAMVDQEDYNGINEMYVSRHGLADRSMAEQRKARRQLAQNAKKGGDGDGAEGDGGVGDDGLTELQRAELEAEQQLQDDEDEEEEDYDPGSDSESDGSGESSDDDDDDEDEEGEGGGDDN